MKNRFCAALNLGLLFALGCSSSSGSVAADAGAATDGSSRGVDAGGGGDAGASGSGGGDAGGPQILDVFFGLVHALPTNIDIYCPGGAGLDGIPVTLSMRMTANPPPTSFQVTTQSGMKLTPKCSILAPATDNLERFTVLLVGDLGRNGTDPPVKLDIVGSVPLDNGFDARGLSSTQVTPLPAGPSMLLGLLHTPADLASASGSACPSSTTQIVLTVWEGGVTDSNGNGLAAAAVPSFHVAVVDPDGGMRTIAPVGLGGTGDHDNFVEVCIADPGKPVSVSVDPGVAFDPNRDANPATTIAVTGDTLP